MIQPFTKGNPEARRKMNEIVDALNNLMRMTGDGFVNVQHGVNGATTLSLSMNELRARFMNFGGATQLHKAYAKAAAPASGTITCYLDTDATGTEISVVCEVAGGTNLNAAFPRLADGDMIAVWYDVDTWRSVMTFQATGTCP